MITRVVTAVAAVLLAFPAGAQPARGALQGQVVDQKTGAPVRFAQVTLLGPYPVDLVAAPNRLGPISPVEISTDEQGRFTFKDLAEGNYAVNTRRDGYMPARYGATGTVRQFISVKGGETATAVSIPMAPCGVVAGKIVNERGEALQNVELVALRYYYGAWLWRPPVTPETPLKAYTNDLGEFRISNLGAGPYVIRAAAAPQLTRNRTVGSVYPTTFYPNALSPEVAEPVTVTSGETSRADFTLMPGPAYRISGSIDAAGSDQEVCFGLAPKVYHAARTQVVGRVTRFGRDGNFILDDVPPGSYVLSASICKGKPALGAIVPLEITGNVENLKIQLTGGRKLAGVVKGEGVDVAGVRLILRSPDLLDGFIPGAVVTADGTFMFDRVLPRLHMVDFASLPAGAYVKSVKYAGRETPVAGFEIDGDATLEIVLSNQGAAQLTGTVMDKSGSPAPYATVTLLPADGGTPGSAGEIAADAQGKFLFPALRPGTYKALAWQKFYNPVGIESADPMLAVLFDANARAVSVGAGAPVSIVLPLNTEDDVNRARVATRNTPPNNR